MKGKTLGSALSKAASPTGALGLAGVWRGQTSASKLRCIFLCSLCLYSLMFADAVWLFWLIPFGWFNRHAQQALFCELNVRNYNEMLPPAHKRSYHMLQPTLSCLKMLMDFWRLVSLANKMPFKILYKVHKHQMSIVHYLHIIFPPPKSQSFVSYIQLSRCGK